MTDEIERQIRQINLDAVANFADNELAGVRVIRLWLLGGFAALMLGLLAAGAVTWREALYTSALVAVASAGFHVATWAMLRAYLWYIERRSPG